MWKFVRGRSQHSSAERQKLQKELFAFRKTVQHGFPNKPTALAWDPELKIAVIGTSSGAIKVYGKCGVEFYGHHNTADHIVMKLVFIPKQGRIVSLLDCNSLHLWEINDAAIEEIKFLTMEGKLKKISCLYAGKSKKDLLVGTEGGNIYLVNLDSFTISDNVIYQDVVMQNVPEGYKINPGAVEMIAEQPQNFDNLLIGYNRGLIVLWNTTNSEALQTYANNLQLESFYWHPEGKQFVSSHFDGSYILWSTDSSEPTEEPITVYGPYPCKSITKILWLQSAIEEEYFIIFGGGMPRASYSDRNTVTVQRGTNKHVVFDFTSKVIDFFAISDSKQVCEALIVLLEEELVAIDLTSEDWRTIPLPYLISLHASAVTFLTYISDVGPIIWNDLIKLGKEQMQETCSSMEWPINGGVLKQREDETVYRDICVTGHEDGSVRFWNAGSTVLSLIYTFKSSSFFLGMDDLFDNDLAADSQIDEEDSKWPPFKKVGCFDPFLDDPRFAVKKISFCGFSGMLIVAGSAGQIIVSQLKMQAITEKTIKITTVNLMSDKDTSEQGSQNWKGYEKLSVRGTADNKNETVISLAAGFQPICIVQILPPTAVTALTLHTIWDLVAIGSAYGVALYDYKNQSSVLTRSTLNPNDISALNEPPISRTKSFKKSLRESFRRIRKGRASVRHNEKQRGGSKSSMSPDSKRGSEIPSSSSPTVVNSLEAKPIERAIEARATDDAFANMVRCLCFARTNIVNNHTLTPSLWAGTNSGTVYIFTIKTGMKIHAQLAKEIQLKHRAPVISIAVIDGANKLLSEGLEADEKVKADDHSSSHHVIIGSEEQFKVFSLPNLRPICKLRLTAMEGAKIRRMALGTFKATNHPETCLMSLTNLGECIVLSLPDLRRLVTAAVIKREDINGISSFIFTKWGEGMYLHSSSEIQRITLSASRKTIPQCTLKLDKSTSKKRKQNTHNDDKLNCIVVNADGTRLVNIDIPEEDEEQDENDESENDDCDDRDEERKNGEKTKNNTKNTNRGDVNNTKIDIKKFEEESHSSFNHDISAITVDSVKDHLSSGINVNEMDVSNSSSNTTIENSVANVSISESRVELSV